MLASEVKRAGAGSSPLCQFLSKVADRLLDRARVRKATTAEQDMASELMVGACGDVLGTDRAAWHAFLSRRAETMASEDGPCLQRLHVVVQLVAARIEQVGHWDGSVDGGVPLEMQPLQMSAVREVLGAH